MLRTFPVICAIGLALAVIGVCADARRPVSAASASLGLDADTIAQWQRVEAPGNSLVLRGGEAIFRAQLNTHSYLARPNELAFPALSARVRPSAPSGISWTTSLFLWWNEKNWCQLGIIDRNGGCGYSVEMVDGEGAESDLATIPLGRPAYLRIELGKGCLRYGWSRDGRGWSSLRIVERPVTWRGAPRLLVIGKGYANGSVAYTGQGLANDYADRGPWVESGVSDVVVAPTAPDRLTLSRAEANRATGVLGDEPGGRVLAMAGDPTYDRVAALFPGMQYPREIVGVPAGPRDAGIDHAGRLELTQERTPTAWFVDGVGAPIFREKPAPTRALMDGYLPIVTLGTTSAGRRYTLTVAGWSDGFSADKPLLVYARLHADGAAPAAAGLVIRGATVPVPMEKDGNGQSGWVRIAMGPTPGAEPCLKPEGEGRLAETRAYWTRLLNQGMQVEVPEKRVRDAFRAWKAWSMLDVDRVNGFDEPHDGSGFYTEIFGYSALLHCLAMDYCGHHAWAERCLDTVMHFQQPDGLYTQQFGLPDMGTLLTVFAEHYRLTGDRKWLDRAAPHMTRAADWLIRMRRKAPTTGLARGLIKFRPYCDYRDPVYDYMSDTACVAGLLQAAEVFQETGRAADASRLRAEGLRYRSDVLRSMDAASITRNGLRVVPMEPETQRLLRSTGYRGGGYYGLVASCMLEAGMMPARDPRALAVAEYIRLRGGLLAGLCEFTGGVDHAYTLGYLFNVLDRGMRREYLLGFYSMLAFGMTRETYAGVECTMLRIGGNANTLPHLYSCTQQIRALRRMLLDDRGDRLVVGEAAPSAWLSPGKQVSVTSAPTRFGDVDIRMAGRARGMTVTVAGKWRRQPAELVVDPQVRPGGRIAHVVVNGRAARPGADGLLHLARPGARTTIEVQYP